MKKAPRLTPEQQRTVERSLHAHDHCSGGGALAQGTTLPGQGGAGHPPGGHGRQEKALVATLRTWEQELLPTAGARQRRVRRYLLTSGTDPVPPVEDPQGRPVRLPPGPGHGTRRLAELLDLRVGAGLPPGGCVPVPPSGSVAVRPGGHPGGPPQAVGVAAEGRAAPTGARTCTRRDVRRRSGPAGGRARGPARHRKRLCTGKTLVAGLYDEQAGPPPTRRCAAPLASTGLGTPWCRETERSGSRSWSGSGSQTPSFSSTTSTSSRSSVWLLGATSTLRGGGSPGPFQAGGRRSPAQ